MSDPLFKYRRLPGRGRRTNGWFSVAAARSSLWLAPDHLLSVDRIWMNEEYKRFYFRDIQAITVQQTNGAAAGNWILGMLAALSAAFFSWAAVHGGSRSGALALWIIGGFLTALWLVLLCISILRGPSCICRLRTAVQTEVLPSLGRTGAARKGIAILKPLIEQTQGALAHGDIGALAPLPAIRPANLYQAISPATPPRLMPFSSGRLHAALFATLILDAAAGFYSHQHPAWHLYISVSSILMLAITGLSITALVRQRDTVVSPGLSAVTIAAFIWNLLILFVVFIYGIGYRVTYTARHPGQLPTHIYFYSLFGFKAASSYADIAELALGVAGLITAAVYIARGPKSSRPLAAVEPRDESQTVP